MVVMCFVVSSPQNPKLKLARGVAAGRERQLTLLDGFNLIEEALSAGAEFSFVFVAEEQRDRPEFAPLLERLSAARVELMLCPASLMAEVSQLDSPTGILAVCRRPTFELGPTLSELTAKDWVLVCAGVQEPGNLGAIVRVGAAIGAKAIICLIGSTSAWSPRAIRGASGTNFRVPIFERVTPEELFTACAEHKICTWSADASGQTLSATARQRTQAVALILGAEGGGIAQEISEQCDQQISIPMQNQVESLNVATAAAIIAWELESNKE